MKPPDVDDNNTRQDDEVDEGSISYQKLSLLLAGALTVIVLLMNVLSPDEIAISETTFYGLVDDRLVDRIAVGDGWLVCDLVDEIAVEELPGVGSRPRRGRLVSVDLRERPSLDEQRQWRHWGVDVHPADEAISAKRTRGQLTGWALMIILLAVGVYYIVTQAKRSKRLDSPRGRLMKLEQELKNGEITQEDYRKRADAISAEL